ncbi:MAG: HAMP domain-containing histidine kinase [SAR324 cluster bacterium]|nr:HAMP domain-containing histidine kinase [SAR324 cluster bacterium]
MADTEIEQLISSIELLKSRIEREKQARQDAESILEEKSSELFEAHQRLTLKNQQLTQLLQQLEEERQKQVKNAYTAGLAENAVSVLHNIGNAVTPASVSVKKLLGQLDNPKLPTYFHKLYETFSVHLEQNDLEHFLKTDPKGQKMMPFFKQLLEQLQQDYGDIQKKLDGIEHHIQHITNIVHLQQKYANPHIRQDMVRIPDLFNDIMVMMESMLTNRKINIIKNFEPNLPDLLINKNQLVQVLLNILKNAIESLDESIVHNPSLEAYIRIEIHDMQGYMMFSIEDNGKGASPETLIHAFDFGFSTKKRGSGFGMHSCASFVRSNNGEIRFMSDGLWQGARIEFILPILDAF